MASAAETVPDVMPQDRGAELTIPIADVAVLEPDIVRLASPSDLPKPPVGRVRPTHLTAATSATNSTAIGNLERVVPVTPITLRRQRPATGEIRHPPHPLAMGPAARCCRDPRFARAPRVRRRIAPRM